MANKRMFSLDVIDTDRFLELPSSAQTLYFHLGMRADDDGFVASPKKICLLSGSNEDDLNLLISRNFIISFPDGVCVIADWRMNNYVRSDRYKKTIYQEHLAQLKIDENTGVYSIADTVGIPMVYQMDTQNRLGKDNIDYKEKEIYKEKESGKPTAPIRHKHGEYKNVLLSDEEMEKLKTEFPADWSERIERLSSYIASKGAKYKNHLATIRNWAKREPEKRAEKTPGKSKFNNYEDTNSVDYAAMENLLLDHMNDP